MENQNEIEGKNIQQINQNPVNQPVQIPEKLKVNYWMISTVVFGFIFLVIMAMFLLGPKIKEQASPIVSIPKPSITSTNINDMRVGDNESYIGFSTCDQSTKFVINKKNLPNNLIHSCESSQKNLGTESVNVVDIFFGPPDDCPSGCIYKRFIGVLVLEKSFFQELPSGGPEGILNDIWGQPPLNAVRNYSGFDCSSELENYIDVTLGKEGNNYGWKLNFKKPLICSWEEFDNVKQVVNKRTLTLNGTMFVYLENGTERWNREELIVK